MPQGREIAEIWVELSLGPNFFFKNQAMVASGSWGLHMAIFRMWGGRSYTKKPYTLEKIGIAVKEELEK